MLWKARSRQVALTVAMENRILISASESDRISILIQRRMYPESEDYWDGNWLVSPIEIACDPFRARLSAGLRAEELAGFRMQLEALLKGERPVATLDSMEEWLHLDVRWQGDAAFSIGGSATGGVARNTLDFSLEGLSTQAVRQVIADLIAVEKRYPVRGRPER